MLASTQEDLPTSWYQEHDDEPLVLLGQDELSTNTVASVVQREHPDITDQLTERLLIAAARVGQHRFARDVLHNHGHRCGSADSP